ncbi:MAG TPA: hypothetical protein VFD47_11170 [Actinomycetota bacterium]|nr:hypothetical protein [Actinomycetota bacterium]
MKDDAGDSGEIRVDRAESDLGIEATKAEDIMTSPVVACREEAYFEEIADPCGSKHLGNARGRR